METLCLCPGHRFEPTDEQLVANYLFRKVRNSLSLSPVEEALIPVCDLYGKEEPWEVWDRLGGNRICNSDDLYVFTTLKKKQNENKNNEEKKRKSGGSRFDRSVGSDGGTWHGEDSGKEFNIKVILNSANGGRALFDLLSLKKRYSYRNTKSIHHRRWILHEYCLPEFSTQLVLYRLRKNGESVPHDAIMGVPQVGSLMEKKRKVVDFEETPCNNSELVTSKHFRAYDDQVVQQQEGQVQEQEQTESNFSIDDAIVAVAEPNDMVGFCGSSNGVDGFASVGDDYLMMSPAFPDLGYTFTVEELLAVDPGFDRIAADQIISVDNSMLNMADKDEDEDEDGWAELQTLLDSD